MQPTAEKIEAVVENQGCRMAYMVRGPASSQAPVPVLMIQGVGLHGEGWRPQVDGLADCYTCCTFDNRGMGQSQPFTDILTVEQMAEDAWEVMDALGWESAHLVGHSLGGLIAQEMALRNRRRVRSLSLLCTFSRGRDATRLTPHMLWFGTRTRIGPRRWRRRAFLSLVMPPDALAKTDCEALAASLAPLFGHDLADQPPIVMKQLSAMNHYDATPRLGELAGIPTLVMAAAHDCIAPPRIGRAMAERIPGARYVQYDDASHGVTIQFADRINNLLRDHLETAERKQPGVHAAALR